MMSGMSSLSFLEPGFILLFLLLMLVCPTLPPLWALAAFFGAYYAEGRAARRQNAVPAALHRYQNAVCFKMLLSLALYAACFLSIQ